MGIIVILFLVMIISSLASALLFMYRGRGDSRRMFRALAIRVGLSVTLFVMLLGGYYFGLIKERL